VCGKEYGSRRRGGGEKRRRERREIIEMKNEH